jgi:mono/diheme cytochrome c family protein
MRAVPFLFLLVACGGEPAAPPAPAPAPEAPAPAPAPEPEAPTVAPLTAADIPPGDAEAGKEVYTTYCVACHQADGTGMGGMLAADFTKDVERMAKSDAELLTSIRDGVTSKRGTMPPWGQSLSDQQRSDALAYIRATFTTD